MRGAGWYYVYILRSMKNDSIYIGCTGDITKRFDEHIKGLNRSTLRMLPLEIIYVEVFKSKKDAFLREKRLKQHGSALRNLKSRLRCTLRKLGEPSPS
ncbi:MAG: GIY-YIG nuclease family protein [bacterium]